MTAASVLRNKNIKLNPKLAKERKSLRLKWKSIKIKTRQKISKIRLCGKTKTINNPLPFFTKKRENKSLLSGIREVRLLQILIIRKYYK